MFSILKNTKNISKSIINICGANISSDTDANEKWIEYNPSLEIQNSKNSFWKSLEIEKKYNLEKDARDLIRHLVYEKDSHLDFSNSVEDTTFEHYFKVISSSKVYYFVKLGKKNWKRKVAIKYKKLSSENFDNDLINSRQTMISEYNRTNYIRAINDLLGKDINNHRINSLTPFYKHKSRVVCIDKINGTVWGVSSDISIPLSADKESLLKQIEIEYWSQLTKKDRYKKNKMYKYMAKKNFKESLSFLTRYIENLLRKNNIGYQESLQSKSEWIDLATKKQKEVSNFKFI
jgi:hypothetical protein